MTAVLDRSEAAEYYDPYISKVPDGDIREILRSQLPTTLEFLSGVSEEQSFYRYAPDKWSMREVLSHVNDTERVFVYRALWFARGFDSELPSFDQNVAIAGAHAHERSWRNHVDDFRAVRQATITFFDGLPDDAWMKRGTASGNPFSVRALAYITAGHVTHHVGVLKERYVRSVER